jgi:hypothetical protein
MVNHPRPKAGVFAVRQVRPLDGHMDGAPPAWLPACLRAGLL